MFKRSFLKTTGADNDRVGHLNIILARGGGKFERSNLQNFEFPGFARGRGGGALLKFRVDGRIKRCEYKSVKNVEYK